jgi:4-hydroxybenzoate polyprenyltransferase
MAFASTSTTTTPPLRALRLIAADIKLAHSVFALPFAVLAAFMAGKNGTVPFFAWSPFASRLALVVLAMFFARTVAMLANRLLDREIDRRNPRTAGRALPSGRLAPGTALLALLICAALFMLICLAFGVLYDNWWPAILGLPVLIWLSAYALFKRFTWLCHFALGSGLAISPLAAAIAVDPASLGRQPALWLLSAMVLLWVAGFDVIYALQDLEVDRAEGLHSIPARLGHAGSLWLSRLAHVLATAALVAAATIDDRFGPLFASGVAAVLALLLVEHATAARWGTTKIALTFFTLNGVISCILGGLGVLDVLGGT